jgi:hypothetical protein
MDKESPEADFGAIGGDYALGVGENIEAMPPPQLDPRIMQLISEDVSEIGEGTLPRIIANPQPMNGTAFATQNQMIDAANSSLLRFTRKAEELHEDLFKVMLMWKIHTGDSLEGYAIEKSQAGKPKTGTTGRPIRIEPATIPRKMDNIEDVASPYAIYLKVTLTNALPIDEVQKLNGGNIMRNLGLPDEMVYEELGYSNPHKIVEGRYRQQFIEAAMSKGLKKLQALAEAEAQRVMNEVQLEMQKKMMELQNPQQGPPQQNPPADAVPPGPDSGMAAGGMPPDVAGGDMSQAVPGQLNPEQMRQQAYAKAAGGSQGQDNELAAIVAAAQGGNFSPNEGGAPMATLAPESLTKEAVTGRDRKGRGVKKGK